MGSDDGPVIGTSPRSHGDPRRSPTASPGAHTSQYGDRPATAAWTDRAILAGSAYRDGQALSARQALYRWLNPQRDPAGIVAARAAAHLMQEPHGRTWPRRSPAPAPLADPGATGPGGASGPAAGHEPRPCVLDVGAGNGLYTRRLHADHPELQVAALDISARILRDVPRPVLVADAAHLPVADGSVSVVLAMHMLYHLADPDAGIGELARVLAPGGLVAVSTNHSRDKHELDELWQAAARDVLGTTQVPARVSLSSRFPLDTAADRLREHFTDLELIDLGGVIEIPEPRPVVAHLASYRAWADQMGVPFAAVIDQAARRLAEHLDRYGTFTITSRVGMVMGKRPR